MNRFFALLLISSCFYTCGSEDDNPNPRIVVDPPVVQGLVFISSVNSPATVYTSLINSLNSSPNTTILADVDHSSLADDVGVELRLTRSVYYDDPAASTPILSENSMAALDLPQQIVIWRAVTGETYLAYSSSNYFRDRHGTSGDRLTDYGIQQEDFTTTAAVDDAPFTTPSTASRDQGISSTVSSRDFDATYMALVAAINNTIDQDIYAEIDFQARANTISENLLPTKLIIFGNANWDSPLIRSGQSACLDLPQKMLVWEAADGTVTISYNNMNYLATRHGISTAQEEVSLVDGLLNSLAAEAAGL